MFRLLSSYNWKWCLVILGAICSLNCLFGLMFKPLPKSQDDDSIGCEKLGDSNSETLLKSEAKEEKKLYDGEGSLKLLCFGYPSSGGACSGRHCFDPK